MKKQITKLMAVIAILLLSIGSVNAQTYLTIANETTVDLTKANIQSLDYLSVTTDNWATAKTYCSITGDFYNMSSLGRILNIDVANVASFDLYVQNSNAGRTFSVTVGSGVSQSVTHAGGNCESFSFSTESTGNIRIKIEGGGSSVYPSKIVLYPPSSPSITNFTAAGVTATINEAAKTITAELPFGTSLAAITPTVTIGGTATSYSPAGAQNFSGGAVNYVASDGTVANDVTYAVTLTASLTASAEKDLSEVMIGGMTPVFNSGTNSYGIILPKAANLTQAVAFTKPITATANFTSGNTHNFATPLTITVTAQDASTKMYALNAVNGIADLAYVTANGSVGANDTKVYPDLLSKGYYVMLVNPTGTDLTQFDASDLVILTEEVASANTLAVAMGGLIGTKPFLNFKAYMYSKSGWPTGAGSNGATDADAAIVSGYESHPLFAGVTITGVNASVFTTPAAKGLQGVTTPGTGAVIANLTSTGNEAVASIIENNAIPSAKYMMIGLANDSYTMVNASGLKLVENAITYLLGNTVFDIGTSVSQNKISGITFDGKIIRNTNQIDIQVYDIAGRKLISSNKDITMSNQAKGIYIVRNQNNSIKICL